MMGKETLSEPGRPGGAGQTLDSVDARIEALVREKQVASAGVLDYVAALRVALADHPELRVQRQRLMGQETLSEPGRSGGAEQVLQTGDGRIEELAREKQVASAGKLDYAGALRVALAEHPELRLLRKKFM